MATTGFWPIKRSLRDALEYARNPDKTTEQKYLDSDLYRALRYAANDSKTDKKMYVTGINCVAQRAYEQMTATKKRFGKLGGNVAYHGYQSFRAGEVTPEEAHDIGMETAKAMWGDEYEVLVTTHLNTENIHNHIIVNSVSFKTGRKFENHIADHLALCKLSDEICQAHGKTVLRDTSFYGGHKKDYWLRKAGKQTHRDLLRRDIDEALSKTTTWRELECYLEGLGYRYARAEDYEHPSLIASGWKRPVRLDSLGAAYTQERLRERLVENQYDPALYVVHLYKPKRYPLLEFEKAYRQAQRMDGLQLTFALITELWKLISGNNMAETAVRPLSPALRQEVARLDQTLKQYRLLCENHIDSPQGLAAFMVQMQEKLSALDAERRTCYNRARRPINEEDKAQSYAKARDISAQITPLRDSLKTANAIVEQLPQLQELLEIERAAEMQARDRNHEKERSYQR